jgi:hypothetical protein
MSEVAKYEIKYHSVWKVGRRRADAVRGVSES